MKRPPIGIACALLLSTTATAGDPCKGARALGSNRAYDVVVPIDGKHMPTLRFVQNHDASIQLMVSTTLTGHQEGEVEQGETVQIDLGDGPPLQLPNAGRSPRKHFVVNRDGEQIKRTSMSMYLDVDDTSLLRLSTEPFTAVHLPVSALGEWTFVASGKQTAAMRKGAACMIHYTETSAR